MTTERPIRRSSSSYIGACTMADEKRGGKSSSRSPMSMSTSAPYYLDPDQSIFSWKVASLCGRPGTIYQFDCPPDKVGQSIFPDTRRYCGRLENDDRVLRWQAEHDAFLMQKELESRERKEKATNELRRQLPSPCRPSIGRRPGPADSVPHALESSPSSFGAGGKDKYSGQDPSQGQGIMTHRRTLRHYALLLTYEPTNVGAQSHEPYPH